MANTKKSVASAARAARLNEATEILRALGFRARQSNEIASYTCLALLDLRPTQPWTEAAQPLRGITPIIDFVAEEYGVRYAPNTRERCRMSLSTT